jgi:hypothetical protein
MMGAPAALPAIRRHPKWDDGVAALRELEREHGDRARANAAAYASAYQGRRGLMVVDVVMSAWRGYERVLREVKKYEATGVTTLRDVLAAPPDRALLGMRSREPETVRQLATALSALVENDEDAACLAWAESTAGMQLAFRVDPTLGGVTGIGLALFCYLRMRCGADGIKPDGRVWTALRNLGLPTSRDPYVLLTVAQCAAVELDVPELVLDQLLWHAPGATRRRGKTG